MFLDCFQLGLEKAWLNTNFFKLSVDGPNTTQKLVCLEFVWTTRFPDFFSRRWVWTLLWLWPTKSYFCRKTAACEPQTYFRSSLFRKDGKTGNTSAVLRLSTRRLSLSTRFALLAKCCVRLSWLIKRLLCKLRIPSPVIKVREKVFKKPSVSIKISEELSRGEA